MTDMKTFALASFDTSPAVIDVPTPVPGEGELLVRVQNASINGFDRAVASGGLKGMMEYRFPVSIGKDFAGEVVALGEGVDGFSVGDAVFGVVMTADLHIGSLSEFLAVPAGFGIAHRPENLDVTTAGALGLAGTTALAAVDATARDGETVLIDGATGGVGSLAIQLAAKRGARVIATVKSASDGEWVRSLGASDVVIYVEDLSGQVRAIAPNGVDGIIHLAGDPAPLVELLADGGRFASAIGFDPSQDPAFHGVATPIMATPTSETLDRLAAEVASGNLSVPIQKTYSLNDASVALDDFGKGTRGKLAVTLA